MMQKFKADQLVPFPSTPKHFLSSYLGFRSFFHFPYLAHYLKTSHFKVWFHIGLPTYFFCFGPFLENSLSEHISCSHSPQNFTRSEEDLFGKKRCWCSSSNFREMHHNLKKSPFLHYYNY